MRSGPGGPVAFARGGGSSITAGGVADNDGTWVGSDEGMPCGAALLRMHDQGLITLPASRIPTARRRPDFPATPASDPPSSLLQPVHEIGPVTLGLAAGVIVLTSAAYCG